MTTNELSNKIIDLCRAYGAMDSDMTNSDMQGAAEAIARQALGNLSEAYKKGYIDGGISQIIKA